VEASPRRVEGRLDSPVSRRLCRVARARARRRGRLQRPAYGTAAPGEMDRASQQRRRGGEGDFNHPGRTGEPARPAAHQRQRSVPPSAGPGRRPDSSRATGCRRSGRAFGSGLRLRRPLGGRPCGTAPPQPVELRGTALAGAETGRRRCLGMTSMQDAALADDSAYIHDLGRAFGGALLFSLPLLMTMEMWALGFAAEPGRRLVFLLAALPVLFGLANYAGFSARRGLVNNALDTLVAL